MSAYLYTCLHTYKHIHILFKPVPVWTRDMDVLQQNQASFPKSLADPFFHPELAKQYSPADANSLLSSFPEASILFQ